MIDDLLHDFRLLQKADSIIARFWLRVLARRFALHFFAGLIAAFGVGMANVAGFYAMQPPLGPIWAAAIIAVVDFALAVIVLAIAANAKPDPSIELAFDVRNMAVEKLQADAREVKANVDMFGSQVRGIKDTVVGLASNPLDAATQGILIPAALSILRGLRSSKKAAS